jgi:hypothetical protein
MWADNVACHVAGEPGGTHDAHSLRTAVHAPERYADAPGLEVSPGDVLKDLLVLAQPRYPALAPAVLLLQLFEPLRLILRETPYSLRQRSYVCSVKPASCKRPELLSITHKLRSNHDAQFDVCQSRQASPDDGVAGWW